MHYRNLEWLLLRTLS